MRYLVKTNLGEYFTDKIQYNLVYDKLRIIFDTLIDGRMITVYHVGDFTLFELIPHESESENE